MIPISVNHGLQAAFLCALHDHLMRWDPAVRKIVDGTCRRVFNLTFDQMLARKPRFIAARTPRHVPPPSVLFNMFTKHLEMLWMLNLVYLFSAKRHGRRQILSWSWHVKDAFLMLKV